MASQEVVRGVELHHLPLVQDKNLIVVDNRGEPVSDGEDRAVREFLLDLPLDKLIRLEVHIRCGLIQDHDFGLPQNCPRQTEELLLSN